VVAQDIVAVQTWVRFPVPPIDVTGLSLREISVISVFFFVWRRVEIGHVCIFEIRIVGIFQIYQTSFFATIKGCEIKTL
jgi:hypothetical protein